MTKVLGLTTPHAVKISKKWDSMSYYGRIIYGHRGYGAADESFGIFQQRLCKEGKITIREKFYVPTQRYSDKAIAARLKFKNARLAWLDLTVEQKRTYTIRAVGLHMDARNLFIKEFMLSS